MEYKDKLSLRIKDYELCNNTYINGESNSLEICKFSGETKYTIGSFVWDDSNECFRFNSCCDRLNANHDWNVIGLLINLGYELLEINAV